ncbi:MAG: DegT/DnrJ/EryC1/StrS family aminotransferase, partial [Thermoplasmata archaeon]
IADENGLHVIEDAAEAHGAEYRGRKAGSFGAVSCFSFYANKIITTGEGGILVTDSQDAYEKATGLKDLAFLKKRRFLHEELGYNYRMTNLQAAIGLAQLERIEDYVKMRRRNAERYRTRLKDMRGLTLPTEKSWAKNVYWMFSVLIDEGVFKKDRNAVSAKLASDGVETRPFFVPIHQQPVLQRMGLFTDESYPIAEMLSRRGLNLPSSTSLNEQEIEYVCQAIRTA